MTTPIVCEIFFDYACPYVHAASVWVRHIEAELGDEVQFVWRYFPLEQINSLDDAGTNLWETGSEHRSRTRDSMQASIASRLQGELAFRAFHNSLLDLRHVSDKDHGKRLTLDQAASTAEMDLAQFHADMSNPALLTQIGEDYRYARDVLGVFGTPTFVFPDLSSSYVKMLPAPGPEESIALWNDFVQIVQDRPYLKEIKRPTPPETD